MDRFTEARDEATLGTERALQAVCGQIHTQGEGIPVVVFNMLGWERTDVVECSVAFSDPDVLEVEVRTSDGTPVPHDLLQTERFGGGALKRTGVLVARGTRPSGKLSDQPSDHPARAADCRSSPTSARTRIGWLENEFVTARFDL
jgi:alpha-mannosidase